MGSSRRVAAIDCGTNTLRLLIADVDPSASVSVQSVVREMRTVRLGEGLEQTGEFSAAALARTDAAMQEYAKLIDSADVDAVRMVATSASRDVRNRSMLIDIVQATVGIDPEVISGDEEGRLTFSGVLSALPLDGDSVVCDIGGGSTEFIRGSSAGVTGALSVDIGVVRLSERHLHDDPPTAQQIAAVADDARVGIDVAHEAIGRARGLPLVAVAGTATTTAAIALGHEGYDPSLIHGARVAYRDVLRVREWACAEDVDGRRAHPAMHPGRAAVFPAGVIILDVVMSSLGVDEFIASESDILDGIALSAY